MSQQIDRLIVSRGPALVTFNGGYFLSKEDIAVDLVKETKQLPSDAYGPLDEINMGVKASLKMKPVGEFEHLAVLWPYASTPVGSSIFGSGDLPLLIQPIDTTQRQVTFHAAAISKMPDLSFTAVDTLIGDVEFQMVGKNNVAIDAANRLFTFANNALAAVPYDPAKLLVQSYTNRWLSAGTFTLTFGADTTGALAYNISAADLATALNALTSITAAGGVSVTGSLDAGWTVTFDDPANRGAITGAVTGMPGGTAVRADVLTEGTSEVAEVVKLRLFPWHSFQAREGVKVAFSLSLEEDSSDAIGHYDTIFKGLSVTASAMPQGLNEETMLAAAALQGSGSVRGTRLGTGSHNLDIFGTGAFFRLYAANIKKAGLIYSSSKQRVPQLEWAASRSIGGGGTLNPLFYIGEAAPV